jgi:hypothetical protein
MLFAIVLVSQVEGDLEAAVARLMEPRMQRGVREWWTIGGRFDGLVQGQPLSGRPREERTPLANNCCAVSRLPADLPCRAIVTPDGVWHEGPTGDEAREASGFTPAEVAAYRDQVDAWARERAALLSAHPDYLAIGVDYGVWL